MSKLRSEEVSRFSSESLLNVKVKGDPVVFQVFMDF